MLRDILRYMSMHMYKQNNKQEKYFYALSNLQANSIQTYIWKFSLTYKRQMAWDNPRHQTPQDKQYQSIELSCQIANLGIHIWHKGVRR